MDDVFLFGSELKALRAHPDFKGEIDRDVLAAYTHHNYVPAPWSIYKGVFKLPQGSFLSLPFRSPRDAAPKKYWDLRVFAEAASHHPRTISLEDATSELDTLLGDAVSSRMMADVPLGAFLSGGIDSSLVTALMQKHSTQKVKTFSIGFGEKKYNEANEAKKIAQHLGTDHTEFYVTIDEARNVIPSLPSMFDEPFADSSQIPTWHVAALARKYVTVALSGDGGDESFAGYGRYQMANSAANILFTLPQGLRRPLGHVLRHLPVSGKARKFFNLMDAADRDDFYRDMMTYWHDNDQVLVSGQQVSHAMNDPTNIPDIKNYIARMMLRDSIAYLPDDVLVKVDRATMAVALEARAPLLDYRVMEFAWSLPMQHKISGGTGKVILRNLLKRYVPEALFDRPKQGFSVPVSSWLRGPLRGWAEDLLSESRLRQEGYFNPVPIRKRWDEHLTGRDDWSQPLWGILMFQSWKDNF
jgi:asparagine synthase (glutamine-hydrolysing)